MKGCRFCTILGVRHGRVTTFPPSSSSSYDYRRPNSYSIVAPEEGQNGPSPFCKLPSFHGASFFPIDFMHMLGLGISRQFWNLLSGDYDSANAEHNPLRLSTSSLKEIGRYVAISRSHTPSEFAGHCGDIYTKSGFYRAVDWLHFMQYLVPAIVLEYINDDDARKAVLHLVNIYLIACARVTSEHAIDQLQSLFSNGVSGSILKYRMAA